MKSSSGPVQLDRDVFYETKKPNVKKNKKKGSGVFIFAGIGLILMAALLLYSPENSGFVETPPPEEQLERDSVAAAAERISAFIQENGYPADPSVFQLPEGYIFLVENDSSWSLETPGGLYFTSDMNIADFQEGAI